jgi:hypothetical protein
MNDNVEEIAVSDAQRLTSWIDWYRFARRTLDLGHTEAAAYATARFVEEQNRAGLRDRGSGPVLPAG